MPRLAYIRELLGPDAALDRQTMLPVDFQFILAEVHCQYRSPATLEDSPVVEIWVSQVGRKSFVFQYQMMDERSRPPARGRVQHAGVVRLQDGDEPGDTGSNHYNDRNKAGRGGA